MDGCSTPEHHGWQHGCQLHTVAVMDGPRAPDARHWTRLLVARSVIDSIMPTVSGEDDAIILKKCLFSHITPCRLLKLPPIPCSSIPIHDQPGGVAGRGRKRHLSLGRTVPDQAASVCARTQDSSKATVLYCTKQRRSNSVPKEPNSCG